MKLLFYDLFVLCYDAAAWLVSPFNLKARLWLKGRVNWTARLQQQVKNAGFQPGDQVVWMHAASLGEFEQGKPVLDELRRKDKQLKTVVSFFSPSGYEVVKHYKGVDIVTYLPTDTPANAARFIKLVKPTLVLWVKYDYWYHHLKTLHRKNVPVLLISAIFWKDQVYFKWYGTIYRDILNFFNHYFVQNEASATLLKEILAKSKRPSLAGNITISGDTRFDRVIDIAENWQPVKPVEDWLDGEKNVLVAGSTWPEDEEELVHFVKAGRDKKFIIAPHVVEPDLLKDTMKLFGDTVLFSDLMNGLPIDSKANVLVINNVGLLSRLYNYAMVCYVGGGFSGSGIHNVLEAAVYGKPVLHGPDYEKYQEAIGLEDAGGSFPQDSAIALEKQLDILFSDNEVYEKAASAAKDFVYQSKGSTREVVRYIQEKRLLTSL